MEGGKEGRRGDQERRRKQDLVVILGMKQCAEWEKEKRNKAKHFQFENNPPPLCKHRDKVKATTVFTYFFLELVSFQIEYLKNS